MLPPLMKQAASQAEFPEGVVFGKINTKCKQSREAENKYYLVEREFS